VRIKNPYNLHDAKASLGKNENVIFRMVIYVWPQKTQKNTETIFPAAFLLYRFFFRGNLCHSVAKKNVIFRAEDTSK